MKLQTSEMVMATTWELGTRASSSTPAGSSSSNRNIQCHYYHKFGHKYSECKKQFSQGNNGAPSQMVVSVAHIDTSNRSLTNVAPQPNTLTPAEI
jgi:hypothetical protein